MPTSHDLSEKTGIIGSGSGSSGGGATTTVEAVATVPLAVTGTRYVFSLTATGQTITFPSDNSAFEITITDRAGNFNNFPLLINGIAGQTFPRGAAGEAFSCDYNFYSAVFSRTQGSSKINIDLQMTTGVPPATSTTEGTVSGDRVPASSGAAAIAAANKLSFIQNNVGFTSFTASATFQNTTQIGLNAGNFLVFVTAELAHNSATTTSDFQVAVSGTSGAANPDAVSPINLMATLGTTSNANDVAVSLPCIPVRCDGTNIIINGISSVGTTLYLKNKVTYTGTAPIRSGSITAIRL